MELKKLTTKIQTTFIGSKFLGVEETEEELSKIIGEEISCYDSGIDDGADDDETEDTYVMYASFQSKENPRLTIRFYYGDVTEEIGCVDVRES
ncbi:MAG: hypothetical protein KBT27_16370 [Prevotellaceae bacterium]|nr:hypothetical protein [Candidatus Faecinaster equi]